MAREPLAFKTQGDRKCCSGRLKDDEGERRKKWNRNVALVDQLPRNGAAPEDFVFDTTGYLAKPCGAAHPSPTHTHLSSHGSVPKRGAV